MRSLLLLVPISLVLLGIAIAAFVWAVRRGQFDDMDTPALDILVDDDGRDEAGHLLGARSTHAPPAAPPQDRPRAD